jgi:UDP-N-acetylglucosamine 2-epimerase (non-hydrolysing)
MVKILSVFGTRPEAIKMAPVMKALEKCPIIESVTCSTGQHREMLQQVLDLFAIKPDYQLDVMQPDQTLTTLTGNLLKALDGVVHEVQPDWIIAQGDTTTVLVASLLAFYHRLKFGHIEAGLRTGDKYRPFPEEANRKIADLLADAYFAPTDYARQTLLSEGVTDDRIYVTGNTVVDALLYIANQPFDWDTGPLQALPRDRRLVLVTAHRRESFGDTFRQLCEAIRELAHRFADEAHFVYPVHMNPNVQKPVREILSGINNISLLEPLDYRTLVHLMKNSSLVLTDSGGIQEEAPTFQSPVLVMRDTTERPEGVALGVAKLVGTRYETIVDEASRLLTDSVAYQAMQRSVNPYGDGFAAERIVTALLGQQVAEEMRQGVRAPYPA